MKKKYILFLLLFNIIIECHYVLGQVSEECKIYNSLNNLSPDTDCCQLICRDEIRVCNEQGQVQCLALVNKKLNSIPEEVYGLISLTHLYLKNNLLNTLPDSLENLINLIKLDLYGNKFNEFPEVITKLPKLKILDIKFNNFTELPSSIGNLKTLTYLGVGGNPSLTTLPKEIGYLIRVTKLNAQLCSIKTLPEEIGNMRSLKELWIDKNHIETLPSIIGNLPSLESLTLSNNPLKSLPAELFKLANLKQFDINNCTNLNPTIINFGSKVDECYFGNTNISCYQPGSCKKINMNIEMEDVFIDENEFLSSNSRECSEKEIKFIKDKINPTSSSNSSNLNYNSKYNLYISIAVCSVIILALIGYICYLKSKKDNKKTNVNRQNSSDVIIYERHKVPDLPSESEEIRTTLPLYEIQNSHTNSVTDVLTAETSISLPTQVSSVPLVVHKFDEIPMYRLTPVSPEENELINKKINININEKELMKIKNEENKVKDNLDIIQPPPPYS